MRGRVCYGGVSASASTESRFSGVLERMNYRAVEGSTVLKGEKSEIPMKMLAGYASMQSRIASDT